MRMSPWAWYFDRRRKACSMVPVRHSFPTRRQIGVLLDLMLKSALVLSFVKDLAVPWGDLTYAPIANAVLMKQVPIVLYVRLAAACKSDRCEVPVSVFFLRFYKRYVKGCKTNA